MKTFENFSKDIDNSKIWIIGIPSGEAFQITRNDLDILYTQKLIKYNTEYINTGFFSFKDEDIDKIIKYVNPTVVKSKSKGYHDINILANDFDTIIIDAILGIVDEYHGDIDFYAQDDCFGIIYGLGDYYIEVTMNDSNRSRYKLVKRYKDRVIDKYDITTDSHLLQRIEHELTF